MPSTGIFIYLTNGFWEYHPHTQDTSVKTLSSKILCLLDYRVIYFHVVLNTPYISMWFFIHPKLCLVLLS